MRQALEGSQAIAQAVSLCRPEVVAAYPITPQTHIVENISKLVADGDLDTELVSVESEFSAASVALGAAAAGARAYTASSSQGILLMAEVLFNIAGLRIPVVMTCANRAVSAPLSIWNDHADSMAVRDCGWIQLHSLDNQEAVDNTVQAFRISQETELPVMICMDGFVLTHTLEVVDMPEQELVDQFLPPFEFSRALDPRQPITQGALVAPEFFGEIRHSHHAAMQKAAGVIQAVDEDWHALTGRRSGGLLTMVGPEDAETGVLALGSMCGTLQEAMETLPMDRPVRLINLRCFRPFPEKAIQAATAGLRDLIVLDRAVSPGLGGPVGSEVKTALYGTDSPPRIHSYAVGLGGRDIPLDILPDLVASLERPVGPFSVFDVDLEKLAPEDR